MDFKKTTAPVNTVTYDKNIIEEPTGNIYEAITIIAKRATQINSEIKKELSEKLDEFATYNDSLEEVFENKEQIEVSKFYERLPKPHAIAVEEWVEEKTCPACSDWPEEHAKHCTICDGTRKIYIDYSHIRGKEKEDE